VIYVDTSVMLAHLLAEDRAPPPELWSQDLVSSRLLEYEVWARLHANNLAGSHGSAARLLLDRIAMLELMSGVLARAIEPFPLPLRTLDAMHLASLEHLRDLGQSVELASYDDRMRGAALAMGIAIAAA
jgi:predicted nucleic acid-binding protein